MDSESLQIEIAALKVENARLALAIRNLSKGALLTLELLMAHRQHCDSEVAALRSQLAALEVYVGVPQGESSPHN